METFVSSLKLTDGHICSKSVLVNAATKSQTRGFIRGALDRGLILQTYFELTPFGCAMQHERSKMI